MTSDLYDEADAVGKLTLAPNIPEPLEEVILRCLEKKPENRYQDGSQLARALEALSTDGNLR